jgi:hypothetical protein
LDVSVGEYHDQELLVVTHDKFGPRILMAIPPRPWRVISSKIRVFEVVAGAVAVDGRWYPRYPYVGVVGIDLKRLLNVSLDTAVATTTIASHDSSVDQAKASRPFRFPPTEARRYRRSNPIMQNDVLSKVFLSVMTVTVVR